MKMKQGTTKVQQITVGGSGGDRGAYFTTIPAAIAKAIDLAKGEVVEWKLADRYTLQIHRTDAEKDDRALRRREEREKMRKAGWGTNWLATPRPEE